MKITAVSKIVVEIIINKGNVDINGDETSKILTPKSANIDISICPAVKFAANLIPKATGLDKLLIISISISKGDNTMGAPLGINIAKKFSLKLIIE